MRQPQSRHSKLGGGARAGADAAGRFSDDSAAHAALPVKA